MGPSTSYSFDPVPAEKDFNAEAGPQGSIGVFVNGIPFIKHPEVATPEEAASLIAFAEKLHHKRRHKEDHRLRLSIMQLSLVENEWMPILRQHAALLSGGDNGIGVLSHISHPTEPLYGRPIAEMTPDYLIRIFAKLHLQFNAEAWCSYSQWVGEEIEQVLSTFKPEDSEEYQLQARLEDFLHEIRSTLLSDLLRPLRRFAAEEYPILASGDDTALKQKEKSAIACRWKIRDLLDIQQELLGLISEGITKIEPLHPELASLKAVAELLKALIDPATGWSARLLAVQLLDQQLGAVSVVTDSMASGRLQTVFSIRTALAELACRHGIPQLIGMCLSWDEANRGTEPADELRRLVVKHAREWAPPLKSRGKEVQDVSSLECNGAWVTFIPEKLPVKAGKGQAESGVLTIDKGTGKAAGMTSEGARLLGYSLGFGV